MPYYEWEDESTVIPYTMNSSVVSHFGINHPKSINDGNSVSYENKSTQLEIINVKIKS